MISPKEGVVEAFLSLLSLVFAIFPPIFQSLDTLHAQNSQSAVLGRLGQPEENEPQYPLGGCRDGQGHLGKREDVAGDAHQKDNHPRAKRERLQKTLDAFHQCGCCRKVCHRHKGSKKATNTNPPPQDFSVSCDTPPVRHEAGCLTR